jgi:two-component system cell cycle sensor histidine kinase/response regulator CckA
MKLIVALEEDPVAAQVLRWALEASGYEVIEAAGGERAVALCSDPERKVDLLIANLRLSTPSGIEAALQVRASTPELPLLFVSGTALEDWPDRDFAALPALLSGRVSFLLKPFSMEALIAAVEKLLSPEFRIDDVRMEFQKAHLYRASRLP